MAYGLLGRKLGHSFSPRIHSMFGDTPYDLYEVEPEYLEGFLLETELTGMNVTIPYKKVVADHCDELSPQAKAIGAVNTIVRSVAGRGWTGFNTDAGGFRHMMKESGLDFAGRKGLVLGDGGASTTVQYVLKQEGAEFTVLSRKGKHKFDEAARYKDTEFVVNTTPVGMYPENGSTLIDLSALPNCRCVMDLIYNPARTKLMLDAADLGIKTVGGLGMLVAQARESAELFTGEKIGDSLAKNVLKQLRRDSENIVLIGMPGSGKSTAAKNISKITGRDLADSDKIFSERYGYTPADCINNEGEDAFRKKESAVLAEVGKRTGIVLATGGGIVTRDENLDPLRQNGRIIWIDRDTKMLSSRGRPISMSTDIRELYGRRKPMYEHFADGIVRSRRRPQDTARDIIEKFEDLTEEN